MTGIMPA